MSQAIPDRWTVLRGAIAYAATGHVPEWLCGNAEHHDTHERGLIERDLQAFQLQLEALKQRTTRSEDADRAHAIP